MGLLNELLVARGPLVLDGAMGTLVEDAGHDVRNPLWGSSALLTPDGRALVERLHRSYVEAGADIVIAHTHNASLAYCQRFLRATGVDSWPGAGTAHPDPARALMRTVNEAAMEAARRAVGDRPVAVAASLASPDVPYARRASLRAEEVAALLRPQLDLLLGLEPDLVIFEMCTTEEDLEGIVHALGASPRRRPVGVGLVCGPDGRMLGGVPMGRALERLAPAAPEAIFVQCTPWDLVGPPLRELAEGATAPTSVGAYGNDGRVWLEGRWCGARVTPEDYADAAEAWWAIGATIVGGCCGTTPSHIAALAARRPRRR